MPLKGVAFSILGMYPHMGLRQSADIDLLLDKNDMACGVDYFKKRGFKATNNIHGRFGASVNLSKDGLFVEIHYSLFNWILEKMYSENFTADVLARSSIVEYEGCQIRLMSKEDLLLYLCLKLSLIHI